MIRTSRGPLLTSFAWFALTAALHAQSNTMHQLSGTVTDASGGAEAGVHISATSNGRTFEAVTDPSGRYTLNQLPDGTYRLTAVKQGFAQQFADLTLASSDGDRTQNLSLGVAPLQASVTVTAADEDQTLGQLPATGDVLTERQVQQNGIQNLDDLNGRESNFLLSDTGSRAVFSVLSFRGFVNNTSSVDPSTAVYIDGVPYDDFFSLSLPLLDVERIEVLKGPQGTLYGADSMAGVVSVVTRAPGNSFHATVAQMGATYGGYQTDLSASGPIIPGKLLIAGAGDINGRNGYILGYSSQKYFNTQFSYSGRVRLDWIPSNHWRLSAVQTGLHLDDGGAYVLLPTDLPLYNQTSLVSTHPLSKWESVSDIDGYGRLGGNTESAQLDYFASKIHFVNTLSRRENHLDSYSDGDYSSLPYYGQTSPYRLRAWNEEARVQSGEDVKRWTWVGGTAYYQDTRANPATFSIIPNNAFGYPTATYDFGNPILDTKRYSIFGQLGHRFLGNHLGITAGIRGEWFQRHLLRTANGFGPAYDDTVHESMVLPKATVDYRVRPGVLVYYTIAEGWVPGGLNGFAPTLDQTPYKKETALSNELGVKTSLFNGVLSFNGSLFHYGVHNFQDQVFLSTSVAYYGNAERATIQGGELAAEIHPDRRLTLYASGGLTDAHFTNYLYNATTGARLDGANIHSVPSHTSSANIRYLFPGNVFAKAEVLELGSHYEYDGSSGYPVGTRFGGYATTNLQVGYERRRWSALVFADNVADRKYFAVTFAGLTAGTGYNGGLGVTGMRRQIGVRTAFHF